jgi:hypothetical protein
VNRAAEVREAGDPNYQKKLWNLPDQLKFFTDVGNKMLSPVRVNQEIVIPVGFLLQRCTDRIKFVTDIPERETYYGRVISSSSLDFELPKTITKKAAKQLERKTSQAREVKQESNESLTSETLLDQPIKTGVLIEHGSCILSFFADLSSALDNRDACIGDSA